MLDLLFDPTPGKIDFGAKTIVALSFIGFLFFLYLITPLLSRSIFKNKKAINKTLKKSRTAMLVFSLLLFFFVWMRMDAVPFLSMRFFFILTLLGFLVYLAFRIRFYIKLKRRIRRGLKRRK